MQGWFPFRSSIWGRNYSNTKNVLKMNNIRVKLKFTRNIDGSKCGENLQKKQWQKSQDLNFAFKNLFPSHVPSWNCWVELCNTGSKFVVKPATNVRKQFLYLNSKRIIGFVPSSGKFADCASSGFTDATSRVTCKVSCALLLKWKACGFV